MEEDIKKVEAVLFTMGRFLKLDEIAQLTGIASQGYLKDVIKALIDLYIVHDSALGIIQQGDSWKLNVRKEYMYLTEKLLSDTEMDGPTQETLAIIAYKTPIMQADVIKIRGNKAYDQIKILEDLDLITKEKSGRTAILKVTGKFYDYFDVLEDKLRSKFDEVVNKPEEVQEDAKK